MNIPTFVNVQYVMPDGFLTSQIQLFTDELNQAMQNGLSNDGWTVPQLTSDEIIEAATFMPDGTLWYATDATPPCFVGLVNGALVKFTTTAFP